MRTVRVYAILSLLPLVGIAASAGQMTAHQPPQSLDSIGTMFLEVSREEELAVPSQLPIRKISMQEHGPYRSNCNGTELAIGTELKVGKADIFSLEMPIQNSVTSTNYSVDGNVYEYRLSPRKVEETEPKGTQ